MAVLLSAAILFIASIILGLAGYAEKKKDYEYYRYLYVGSFICLSGSIALVFWFMLSFQ